MGNAEYMGFISTMSEKLCLKWNDFQDNINATFGKLRSDEDFCDVTLACEDGQQVTAHKVILAASSPFFQNLLRKNKHPHPLVYMRGVKSEDMVAVLDFIYHGEANVYQENIDNFLAFAQEIKLKGVEKGSNPTKDDDPLVEPIKKKRKYEKRVDKEIKTASIKTEHKELTENETGDESEANTSTNDGSLLDHTGDFQTLDDQIKPLMSLGETYMNNGKTRCYKCTVCGKEGGHGQIKGHIEAQHLEGVAIPCVVSGCEKTFRTRAAIKYHDKTHSTA